MCDLNLVMKNYQAARLAVRDLEILKRNDANTYLMKLRVYLCQLGGSQGNQELISDIVESLG